MVKGPYKSAIAKASKSKTASYTLIQLCPIGFFPLGDIFGISFSNESFAPRRMLITPAPFSVPQRRQLAARHGVTKAVVFHFLLVTSLAQLPWGIQAFQPADTRVYCASMAVLASDLCAFHVFAVIDL